MRIAPRLLCAALLGAAVAAAAEPAAAPAPGVPEPNVQRTVIEDDSNRVEELRVRGQTRSVVVTTKGVLASSYEIHIGDLSRDLGDSPGSRIGSAGQRVWRLFSF